MATTIDCIARTETGRTDCPNCDGQTGGCTSCNWTGTRPCENCEEPATVRYEHGYATPAGYRRFYSRYCAGCDAE
jgi:hypothetical protein